LVHRWRRLDGSARTAVIGDLAIIASLGALPTAGIASLRSWPAYGHCRLRGRSDIRSVISLF